MSKGVFRRDITLTLNRLREVLDYDREEGDLIWRIDMGQRGRIGRVAGTFSKTSGYILIKIDWIIYPAHRLAWFHVYGEWPIELDHINNIRDDNRIENLRIATRAQNAKNRLKPENNTSGLKGVSWKKANQAYQAQIVSDKQKYYLGLFDCPAAAHFAYVIKADELHGRFARSE